MDIYEPYKPNKKNSNKITSNNTSQNLNKSQLDLSKLDEIDYNKNKRNTGINKAAKLLLVLGVEEASKILNKLNSNEIEILTKEMSNIDKISVEEKNEVLKEFNETLDTDKEIQGGISEAKKFLIASLGEEATENILKKINKRNLHLDFEFLETIEPQALASVLSNEHSQVVSVALAYLKPKTAAEVLKYLSVDFRSEVAMRLAKSAKIHPEAVQKVAEVLRNKFEKRDSESYTEVGGVQTLAQILNFMEREYENEILEDLEIKTPDIIESVKEHLYTIEELIKINNKEMRLLVSNIKDNTLLAKALRGMHQDLRLHFFNSMSQNRAANVLDEIEKRGPIHVKEINDARTQIINIARSLEEDGLIRIKIDKDVDEYI